MGDPAEDSRLLSLLPLWEKVPEGRMRGLSPRTQSLVASLPRRREIVAYCRGPYCVYADDAVRLLRARGLRAQRLDVGFPEWQRAGFPVAATA